MNKGFPLFSSSRSIFFNDKGSSFFQYMIPWVNCYGWFYWSGGSFLLGFWTFVFGFSSVVKSFPFVDCRGFSVWVLAEEGCFLSLELIYEHWVFCKFILHFVSFNCVRKSERGMHVHNMFLTEFNSKLNSISFQSFPQANKPQFHRLVMTFEHLFEKQANIRIFVWWEILILVYVIRGFCV